MFEDLTCDFCFNIEKMIIGLDRFIGDYSINIVLFKELSFD